MIFITLIYMLLNTIRKQSTRKRSDFDYNILWL